jgi:hypothetical protein
LSLSASADDTRAIEDGQGAKIVIVIVIVGVGVIEGDRRWTRTEDRHRRRRRIVIVVVVSWAGRHCRRSRFHRRRIVGIIGIIDVPLRCH